MLSKIKHNTALGGVSRAFALSLVIMISAMTLVFAASPAYAQSRNCADAENTILCEYTEAGNTLEGANADRFREGLNDLIAGGDAQNSQAAQDVLGYFYDRSGQDRPAIQAALELMDGSTLEQLTDSDVISRISGLEQGGALGNLAQNIRNNISDGSIDAEGLANAIVGDRTSLGNALGRGTVGTPTVSDILASTIFTTEGNNKGGAAASTFLPMDSLERYGHGGNQEVYGDLSESDAGGPGSAASQAAEYIRGIYKYKWLVGVDLERTSKSEDPNVNPGAISMIAMSAGEAGAVIFDGVSSVLRSLEKALTAIDVSRYVGLSSSDSPYSVANDAKNEEGTFGLGKMLEDMFQRMGLTPAFSAIQFITASVIGFIFLAMLLYTFSGRGRVLQNGQVRNMGVRIMVMVMAIPFAIAATTAIGSMTKNFADNQFNSAASINDNYIFDSLNWAAATNLSFENATNNALGGADALVPGGLKDSENAGGISVNSLNTISTEILGEAAGDDVRTSSAADLLSKYRSGEVSDVNDYFAKISQRKAGRIAAAYTSIGESPSIRGPEHLSTGKFKLQPSTLYFLSERASQRDNNSIDEENDGGTPGDSPNSDSGSDTARKVVKFGEAARQKGVEFRCERYTCHRLKWNDPQTYIYGVTSHTAATPQTKNSANYFGGDQTMQNVSPENGKKSDDEKEQDALNANALGIATVNRTAGIKGAGGSTPSLSTQSVAFLLQSSFSNDTLQYQALQASKSESGYSDSTINRKGFVRFTVPNTGDADLFAKTASIAMMWTMAGMIAVIALLALMRKAVLSAIFNMIKGFFSALFLGNIAGLVNYAIYYAALVLSFVTTVASITFSIQLADFIGHAVGASSFVANSYDLLPEVNRPEYDGHNPIENAATNVGGQIADATNSVINVANNFVGSVVSALVCLILAAIMAWPLINMPRRDGGSSRESLISIMIGLPFLLADRLADSVNDAARKLGHNPSTKSHYTGQVSGVDPRTVAAEKARRGMNLARTGAAVAAGASSGGASTLTAGLLNRFGKNGDDESDDSRALVGGADGADVAALEPGASGGPHSGDALMGASDMGADDAAGIGRDGDEGVVLDGAPASLSGDDTHDTLIDDERDGGLAPVDPIEMVQGSDGVYYAQGSVPHNGAARATGSGSTAFRPHSASGVRPGAGGSGVQVTGGAPNIGASGIDKSGLAAAAAAGAAGAAAGAARDGGRRKDDKVKVDSLSVDAGKVSLNGDKGEESQRYKPQSNMDRDAVSDLKSNPAPKDTGRDGGSKSSAPSNDSKKNGLTRRDKVVNAAVNSADIAKGLGQYKRDDGAQLARTAERLAGNRNKDFTPRRFVREHGGDVAKARQAFESQSGMRRGSGSSVNDQSSRAIQDLGRKIDQANRRADQTRDYQIKQANENRRGVHERQESRRFREEVTRHMRRNR